MTTASRLLEALKRGGGRTQHAVERLERALQMAEDERRRYAEQSLVAAATVRALQREREERQARRTDFLAAAAHDLRQPLSAVTLYADLLSQRLRASDPPADEAAQRYLQVLRDEIRSLATAFDTILDYSQLESGRIRADPQPCRLADILADLERRFTPLAAERGLRLQVQSPGVRCVVRTDRELLTRLLSNLLANAVKYGRPPLDLPLDRPFGPRGSTPRPDVRVRLRVRGLLATVVVMDRGPGIAAEARDRIFDAGFQVGNAERDRRSGFGLGLATVRSIVTHALPDHNVRLLSVPGRGSHFMVDVPLDFGNRELAEAPFPTSVIDIRRRALDGAKVVIVEDDAGVREGLTEVLKADGAYVVAAGSLAAALEQLEGADRLPDLILTDWRLPQHVTGRDVVLALRRRCLGRELPAFVITADEQAAEAATAGMHAVEVIRKPVGRKPLLTRLAAHYRAERSPLEGP